MACSCAAVTTPTGFGAELRNGSEAIVCGFDDVEAMKNSVLRLLNNDDERLRIARAGWERVRSLKWASNIKKLAVVFRKRVIIVADSDEPEGFVRNFFGNIAIHDIEIRDVMGEKNIMLTIDEKDRGIAIGRDGERIKAAKSFLKKKFNATVHIRTRRSVI